MSTTRRRLVRTCSRNSNSKLEREGRSAMLPSYRFEARGRSLEIFVHCVMPRRETNSMVLLILKDIHTPLWLCFTIGSGHNY